MLEFEFKVEFSVDVKVEDILPVWIFDPVDNMSLLILEKLSKLGLAQLSFLTLLSASVTPPLPQTFPVVQPFSY